MREDPKPPGRNRFGLLGAFTADFLGFGGRRVVTAGLLVLAGSFLEGVGLLMLVPLLTILVGPGTGHGVLDQLTRALLAVIPASSLPGRLVFVLAIFALLMALRAAVVLSRDVRLTRLQVGFVQDRRLRVIRLLANSRWSTVARLRHGRITHTLGSDIQSLRQVANFVIQSTVAAAMLAGQTILAFLISPVLALVIVVMLLLGALMLRPVVRASRRSGLALLDANLGLVNSTTQFLGGLKLAFSQSLEQGFVDEFDRTLADAARREIAFARQRTGAQLALTSLAALLAGGVLLFDVVIVGVSPAALIALLVVLTRTTGPAVQIQQGVQQIAYSLPAYAKITGLEEELAAAQRSTSESDAAAVTLELADIEFRDVTFRHPDRSRDDAAPGGVFDLSIRIEEGACLGISGPSGAGKTTFADLLVGLYAPQSGAVLVGGEPLEGARLSAWRKSIGYVSQDPFLFHDTIRNNLLWARPDAGEDELWALLALAGAEDLVRDMDERLDTMVGERGGLLSGGERQRIALARALLRRPRLLLLDEATNAIDVAGEAAILSRLGDLRRRPTLVMIAHRQSSLDHVDRVVTLAQGRIAADRMRERSDG